MMRWMAKLERVLLVIGLVMIGCYAGARIYALIVSRGEVESFKNQEVMAQELKSATEAGDKSPDFALWSTKRIEGYEESLGVQVPAPTAVLRVPKIHLEVPVLEGTDDLDLNRGVGHIGGTALPGQAGNIGIAGHRDGFFRGLKDVEVGDTIEILTRSQTNTYVIDQITIVDPSDVSVLAPRLHPSVTLVTCYPFYFVGSAPKRYIVQASLVGGAEHEVGKR